MPSPSSQADQSQALIESVAAVHSVETATPATESTASITPALTESKRRKADFEKARSDERRRVTTDIRKFVKSGKAYEIGCGGRVEMLFDLRKDTITAAEQHGKGSVLTRFPDLANEKDERRLLMTKFADFILDGKFLAEASKVVGVKQHLGCSRDGIGVEAVDKDDEEKDIIKEEPDRSSESATPEVVASVAIIRGFPNGKSEVSPTTKANTARLWKKIGGRWVVLPRPPPEDMLVSTKRKPEDVDRERESKMARLH